MTESKIKDTTIYILAYYSGKRNVAALFSLSDIPKYCFEYVEKEKKLVVDEYPLREVNKRV